MTVTITRDERLGWTVHLASWRTLAVGWGCGSAYLPSARDLVALPEGVGEEPVVLRTDEDLLVAIKTEGGWVLVCETSVRLITGQDEACRIDLGEVIERAWWTGESLQIEDARGITTVTTLTEGRLGVCHPC